MSDRRASTELARLGRQAERLQRDFTQSRAIIRHGRLLWSGEVQPSHYSRKYRLELQLDPLGVIVEIRPRLPRPEGAKLPHVFARDELCLFFDGEWDTNHVVAETIVPWAAEWLLFYEFWLTTGEWLGGGHTSTAPANEE
jgi:hypothetical protein